MSEREKELLESGEWNYRFHERLGILIDGTRKANLEEVRIASAEAHQAIDELLN